VHARLRIAAPAEAVLARINPTVGVVESVSDTESVLVTGADSLDTIAAYIGMLGMDFTVESPAELRQVLRTYSERYARAASV
jgi:predicted DNA-binding transcriptional regulator YafY